MTFSDIGPIVADGEALAGEWADRSDHWLGEAQKLASRRNRRERNSTPLILCGHGASLRIENRALVIRDGFTHYPQEQAKHCFFPGDLSLPPRILLLDGSGTLSFDVLSWLADQRIALARVTWTGEVATVASGSGFAADREKVRWQEETRSDEARRLAFTVDLISRKLTNCAVTLQQQIAPSPAQIRAIDKNLGTVERFSTSDVQSAAGVRSFEGECAAAYFAAWQGLQIEWKSTTRRPIPDEWRRFTSRSSLANGVKPKNVNASHPVNAMLNYAYAVKLAHLQIQAIADGYDPTIGILHQGRLGQPAFVFDLIEPERPKVDAVILGFVQSRSFSSADFIIRRDGVCRLSPQLARMIATIASAT